MKTENKAQWGPYLSFGANAATEMRISWRTDQYFMQTQFWYGVSPVCEQEIIEDYDKPKTHHCVILQNLNPNTKYYYRIKSGDPRRDKTAYEFKTGPIVADISSEGFDFTVLGDIHANGEERIRMNDLFPAISRNVKKNQFYLALGDSVDDGHRARDWGFFFENVNPWLSNSPLMNTTGNHDCGTPAKYARFLSIWDHPYVNSKLGGYYSFQYADILFIMADSDNAGNSGAAFSDEQIEWIEQELARGFKEDLWLFVCFHRQMYSTGDFSMEPLPHQYYRPLFDEYHVDCVMYGHDHNYQLFWTDRDADWGGTKYFVCGASGGPERTELKILGPNSGNTIYIWPGFTYSYERDGILPKGKENDFNINTHRNDAICQCQIYGVLVPNFVHVHITKDTCDIRCIGFQDQQYHSYSFKKTKKKG